MSRLRRELILIRSVVEEVVSDMGECSYLGHEGDRDMVDFECPGTRCFLASALTWKTP